MELEGGASVWSETRRGEREDKGLKRRMKGGRHKGVDKVAIAHGTQLHGPTRAICPSLSSSLCLPAPGPAALSVCRWLFGVRGRARVPSPSPLAARPPSALPPPEPAPLLAPVFQAPFNRLTPNLPASSGNC